MSLWGHGSEEPNIQSPADIFSTKKITKQLWYAFWNTCLTKLNSTITIILQKRSKIAVIFTRDTKSVYVNRPQTFACS